MSSFSSILSQVNSLTGYNLPTASVEYYISTSVPLTSGSVNQILAQINGLTGYNIPATEVTFISGSNVSSEATIIYVPTPATGTIPTTGIYPGAIIEAEHLLRIINALNGVNQNLIIMSGSLYVSGSATFAQDLNLPFVPNEDFIESVSGSMQGTDTVDGGSF